MVHIVETVKRGYSMKTRVPVRLFYKVDKVVEFIDGLKVKLNGSDLASKKSDFQERLKDEKVNESLISIERVNMGDIPSAHFHFLNFPLKNDEPTTTELNIEAGEYQGESRVLTSIEIKTIVFG
jgi:hypothetical protein